MTPSEYKDDAVELEPFVDDDYDDDDSEDYYDIVGDEDNPSITE